MLRLLFRLIGLMTLAGAFACAVIDGARTLADQRLETTSLGEALGYLSSDKFAALPALVARIHPRLWDPVLLYVLYVPTFVLLAILGAFFMIVGRGRSEPEIFGARR